MTSFHEGGVSRLDGNARYENSIIWLYTGGSQGRSDASKFVNPFQAMSFSSNKRFLK
jgi:hypothetical protein